MAASVFMHLSRTAFARAALALLLAALAAARFGAVAQAQPVAPAASGASAPAAPAAPPALPMPAASSIPPAPSARSTPTTNAALSALLQGLAAGARDARATQITLLQPGRSARGVAIEALHATRGPGRPVVLLVGQQHGDEPAGAEAVLALAQAVAAGRHDALLEHIDLVLLPRANPDGAASGSRGNAAGADVNRDHLVLRTPEAQAIAALLRQFDPAVVIDLHEHGPLPGLAEAFGGRGLPRHDLMLQVHTVANADPALQRAADAWLRQPVLAALQRAGLPGEAWHAPAPGPGGEHRLTSGGAQPDALRNLQGLRHGLALLLETRGIGAGRPPLEQRVRAHATALQAALASITAHAAELAVLREQAQAATATAACRTDHGAGSEITVLAAPTLQPDRPWRVIDPATGVEKTVTVPWLDAAQLRPLVRRARPCAYWLAADADEAARRLQLHGLRLLQLAAPATLKAETWRVLVRFDDAPAADEGTGAADMASAPAPVGASGAAGAPRSAGASGAADAVMPPAPPSPPAPLGPPAPTTPRRMLAATFATTLSAPAGSWLVPLDQPLALVAIAALEPDAPFSHYARRVLPALDDAARIVEPLTLKLR